MDVMKRPHIEEILSFSNDLYKYLWSRHKFKSEELGTFFAEKLANKNSGTYYDHLVASEFNEDVGKAVFNSQFLLRDYCEHFFGCMYDNWLTSEISFDLGIFCVIMNYIRHSKDVFGKFIDCAAIVAEAILFCDSREEIYSFLDDGPEILTGFMVIIFEREFFGKGGWQQLNKEVSQLYSQLDCILEPFVNSIQTPYEKLDLSNCEVIKRLRHSPIMFPIAAHHFCKKCESPSDNLYFFYYHQEWYTLIEMASEIEDTSDITNTEKIIQLKKDYYKTITEVPFELNAEYHGEKKNKFACVFIGKWEEYTKWGIIDE